MISNKITYETNPRFDKLRIESHIRSGLDVNYFDKNSEHAEFVCVSCYDYEKKEEVKIFISEEALDTFIEKVSVICALRFNNKGEACQ